MAKKKTTEAINREQEVMEEKEALPSFFTNLFSSASNPLPNRAVLEYTIMHSAPVKANTEGYRAMMKVDKRTAEDIKHRLYSQNFIKVLHFNFLPCFFISRKCSFSSWIEVISRLEDGSSNR